jgi:hypothetical protein
MAARDRIKGMYSWSPWQRTRVTWAGVDLYQRADFSIISSQEDYCHRIEEIKIEPNREGSDSLVPKETTQFRAGLMKCQWRATQTAPQYATRVSSLASQVNVATIKDLREVNSLIREVKKSSRENLIFHAFNHTRAKRLEWYDLVNVVWSDASKLLSRGGMIHGLAPPELLQGLEQKVSIMDWRSHKLARPGTGGSNGCEGQALYESENRAWKNRLLWAVIHGCDLTAATMEHVAATTSTYLIVDSKGVYDAIHNKETFGIGMADSRTGVEVLHVKVHLGEAHKQWLLWCSSDLNLADGMTKDTPEARKPMALWQSRKTWIVKYDPNFVSARRKQQLNRKVRDQEAADNALADDPEVDTTSATP